MSKQASDAEHRVIEHRSWTRRDAVIYALGVGAGGLDDQGNDLRFVLEEDPDLAVLPSYGTVLARRGEGLLEGIGVDRATAKIVHGEQHLRLHATIPVDGTLRVESRLIASVPKQTGTVVWAQTDGLHDGKVLLTSWSASFVRGASLAPFGVAPQFPNADSDPAGEARSVTQLTRREQALWYRLSGDLNPLHTDPGVARRAGFETPILHGLSTFGFAARHILSLSGKEENLLSIGGRFRSPVLPGEGLTTRVQRRTDGQVSFEVVSSSGAVAISRGYAEVRDR